MYTESSVFLFLRAKNFHQINSCKKLGREVSLNPACPLTVNPSNQVCSDHVNVGQEQGPAGREGRNREDRKKPPQFTLKNIGVYGISICLKLFSVTLKWSAFFFPSKKCICAVEV